MVAGIRWVPNARPSASTAWATWNCLWVPQLRVHDLRHSCATPLSTMGVQPATVQRILRHSSITVTTGTYVEVIEAVQRDALDSMGSLFATAPDTNK